jgi:hypothetical protein
VACDEERGFNLVTENVYGVYRGMCSAWEMKRKYWAFGYKNSGY